MEKARKIISLGDIHGRSVWKNILFGNPHEFEQWVLSESQTKEFPLYEYDKIIFIGDYVDSFTVGNVEMKKNLEDLILLKRAEPDRVELLLGNHDISYIMDDQWCSGFRPEMKWDFRKIFNDNADLFKLAHYEYIREAGCFPRQVLWTHAGVTTGWWDNMVIPLFANDKHKFAEILKEIKSKRIDDIINHLWEMRLNVLFTVDHYSGGSSAWAGPLWVRPEILNEWWLEGYDQVVGHTPQHSIWTVDLPDDSVNAEDQDRIYYIDTLEHGDESILVLESLC
jgi:hypothetical protein